MVQGNWERRIELTNARRAAAKLEKANRRQQQQQRQVRPRSNSTTIVDTNTIERSVLRLEEWLVRFGQVWNGDDNNANDGFVVDVWTDICPMSRRIEYEQYVDNYNNFVNGENDDIVDDDGNKHDDLRGGVARFTRKGKGKAHPNTKSSRMKQQQQQQQQQQDVSNNKLCANEFFFGNCESVRQSQQLVKQQPKGGRRKSRGDSITDDDQHEKCCSHLHYQYLPKVKKDSGKKNMQQQKYNVMTLSQVLGGGEVSKQIYNKSVLKSAFNASAIIVPSVVDGGHAGGDTHASSPSFPYINMVHHTQLVVDNGASGMTYHKQIVNDKVFVDNNNEKYDEVKDDDDDDNNDDDDDDVKGSSSSKFLTALQQILNGENLSLPSIVYLTIDGILVYDRNRDDGLIVTKEQEQYLLFGEPMIVDDFAALSMYHLKCPPSVFEDNNHLVVHEQLTHSILDEIISYSEDTCVVTLSLVCKCWYTEIGKLWKMLLQRHRWPETVNDDDNDGGGIDDDSPNYIAQCREAFISHYKVVRDISTLVNAIEYTMFVGGGNSSGSSFLTTDDAEDKAFNNVGIMMGFLPSHKLKRESAIHSFKDTKGAHNPERDEGEMVQIWTEVKATNTGTTMAPRALAVYPKDFTLRLFEVAQGKLTTNNDGNSYSNEATAPIKCRQVVCLHMKPLFFSQKKKDSCKIMSFDLDDESVACLVDETFEPRPSPYTFDDLADPRVHPWLILVAREDIVCAGNEDLLEDDCLQLYDLRQLILDHILSGSEDDIRYKEMHDALHNYLASEECILSDILIHVKSKVVACGRGAFLFAAHIFIPPRNVDYSESDSDNDGSGFHRVPYSPSGQRLFLFSTKTRDDDAERTGKIITSISLDIFDSHHRQNAHLFASRPFKNSSENASDVMLTNVLISHQNAMSSVPLFSVVVRRNGTADISKKSEIDCRNLHPRCSKVDAVLTSTLTVFTTSSYAHDSHPRLHVQTMTDSNVYSIDIGEVYSTVHKLILIRDHYIAVICKIQFVEDEDYDGSYVPMNTLFSLVVVHIPTRKKIYFNPLRSGAVSVDCLDDILAMNVSNLGFVFTGESVRDIARMSIKDHKETPGKSIKKKKKRLASIVGLNGKKKDGFARGSCSHKS